MNYFAICCFQNKLNLICKWKECIVKDIFHLRKNIGLFESFNRDEKKLFLKHLKRNIIWLFEVKHEFRFDSIKMKKRRKKDFAAFCIFKL